MVNGNPVVKPLEVDAILREKWGKTHQGTGLQLPTHFFMGRYGDYLFSAGEFPLPRIDGTSLRCAIFAANDTSSSSDHVRNRDLKLLPPAGMDALASVLNAVEESGRWPKQLLHGVNSYLLKPGGDPYEPLDYRPILILSIIYRRWASLRLRQMRRWVESWQLEEMFAGIRGRGAADAWWSDALLREWATATGQFFAASDFDIFKCFDQLPRDLVIAIAVRAGFPSKVARAYLFFHDNLSVRNKMAQGYGEAHHKEVGIPQGCPFSMVFLALILRPWILLQRAMGTIPRTMADDTRFFVFAYSIEAVALIFRPAFEMTAMYIQDLGSVLSFRKCASYASGPSSGPPWPLSGLWTGRSR